MEADVEIAAKRQGSSWNPAREVAGILWAKGVKIITREPTETTKLGS